MELGDESLEINDSTEGNASCYRQLAIQISIREAVPLVTNCLNTEGFGTINNKLLVALVTKITTTFITTLFKSRYERLISIYWGVSSSRLGFRRLFFRF